MILIPSLSSEGNDIYEVDEGVMALKETITGKVYYFPATTNINLDEIKSRPVHHIEDIEDLIDFNE